jgi:hypothetical protein
MFASPQLPFLMSKVIARLSIPVVPTRIKRFCVRDKNLYDPEYTHLPP